jgi:glutaredoxin 3
MTTVKVYTMQYCPYCESAKKLLKSKNIPFDEILVDMNDDATWTMLEKKTGYKTMPQIFIGEKFVGGYNDLANLDRKGELDRLINA